MRVWADPSPLKPAGSGGELQSFTDNLLPAQELSRMSKQSLRISKNNEKKVPPLVSGTCSWYWSNYLVLN